MDLNPLLFSSENEDDASADSDSDSALDSGEVKEPEDDGHPEAGNSAAEICTPELP